MWVMFASCDSDENTVMSLCGLKHYSMEMVYLHSILVASHNSTALKKPMQVINEKGSSLGRAATIQRKFQDSISRIYADPNPF